MYQLNYCLSHYVDPEKLVFLLQGLVDYPSLVMFDDFLCKFIFCLKI